MENDLMNEEKNDKVSNKLPEPYIKRAKMSGNVLLVFIIITLVVLLPVDISLFVEKDYNLAIITTIILLIIVVPLFLIVYILKNKPERIIHPGEGFININSKSYKDVRNTIIQEINKIYGVDKPYMNFKVSVLYAKKYGGDPRKIVVTGHSAGGYLSMMLCLNKAWLKNYKIDADSVWQYIPFSGQAITHYNVRKMQGIKPLQPTIDEYAPLYWVRNDCPPFVLICGDRELELYGRYDENQYLERMMKLVGHKQTYLYEIDGHGHVGMVDPADQSID